MAQQDILRNLPKIDELLSDNRLEQLLEETSHTVVKEKLRDAISFFRNEILEGSRDRAPSAEDVIQMVLNDAENSEEFHLRPLVNATGVVLHTNLGRAILSKRAQDAVLRVASGYSNLEYNIEAGVRGSRHDHVSELLCRLTGAEDAMVLNNNAAAVELCLAALAEDKEVILSRGESVEIGGSFRVPAIMEMSGAILKEVGTTNRTHLYDYENAINENTGALLKVHTSNYRIVGFTLEASLAELATLKEKYQIPLIYDMGSGLFYDLSSYGIDEPTISQVLHAGADVVLFSGDKMLGGPQGGFAVGKKEYISKMKKHQLARAFRVDKMTLAASEATFYEYQDLNRAKKEIPTLRMIMMDKEKLRDLAEKYCAIFEKACINPKLSFHVEPTEDKVGGGSAPLSVLQGYAITISGDDPEKIASKFRFGKMPVIVTTQQDKVWISVRTIQAGEELIIAEAIKDLL